MALINCNECNNEVSDKAAACPKCGAPVADAKEPVLGTKTIQETSKKLKLQTLISLSLTILGFVWIVAVIGVFKDNGNEFNPLIVH